MLTGGPIPIYTVCVLEQNNIGDPINVVDGQRATL